MDDPFSFFMRPLVQREGPLPPEAATTEGWMEAMEQMLRALNFIAQYDTAAMVEAYNAGLIESDDLPGYGPHVVNHAVSVKAWLDRFPDMKRPGFMLSVSAAPIPPGLDKRN